MQEAALLLRQESKECCGPELLAVDTIRRNLAVTSAPVRPAEQTATLVPVPGAEPQKSKPVAAKNNIAVVAPRTIRQPQAAPIQYVTLDADQVGTYATMVSNLTPDPGLSNKHRTESAILYFDYPIGKDDIYPDYKNNRAEIDKIDRIMRPLCNNRFSNVIQISVRGYSSPDGPYGDNERLAKARSGLFAAYIRRAYGIPRSLISVSSVAEDWEGFTELLHRIDPPYKEATLRIIRNYGIFNGREKHLMDLQGGVPYKDMLRRFFPKLRRIEVVVQYDVRKIDGGEAGELIYTHPDLPSLEEMYEVARYYRPGTDQYREVYEVAAFHFPDDVVANVNAASAVMLTGDLKSAWDYLRKVEADPRAWNNIGVLTLMEGNPEGAAVWFRKAVGVDPRRARRNLEIAESIANENE